MDEDIALINTFITSIKSTSAFFHKVPFAQKDFYKTISREINIDDYFEHINFLRLFENIRFDENITKYRNLFLQNSVKKRPTMIKLLLQVFFDSYSVNERIQKLFIGLLISIVEEVNDFYDIFDVDSKKWELLFSLPIFSKNPTDSCEMILILHANTFLFNSIYRNGHLIELFDKIFEFIQKNGEKSIYNFLPLFLNILFEPDTKYINTLISSKIFLEILRISQNELPIFDYLRHLVFAFPLLAFENQSVTESLSHFFFDEDRNKSIVLCIEEAFNALIDDRILFSEFLSALTFIVKAGAEKHSNLVFGIFPAVDNFFSKIPSCIDTKQFLIALSNFAVSIPDAFEQSLMLVRRMLELRPAFIFKLDEIPEFFENLSKFNHNVVFKCLIDLATCSTSKIMNQRFIRNYKAIQLLLSLVPNISENEEDIVQSLIELCNNKGNILELERSNLSIFILNRLIKIQDYEEIRKKYLLLFNILISHTFTKIAFYKMIELLKNHQFKFSNDVLEIMNQLYFELKNDDSSNFNLNSIINPQSFFRFYSPNGCGIFCPSVNLTNCYSINFCMRLNEILPNQISPILYFDLGKSSVEIGFQNNILHIVENNRFHQQFTYQFEQGKWYFMTLLLIKTYFFQKLILFVNENKIDTVHLQNKLSYKCPVYICAKPPFQNESSSLICDISTIVFLDNFDDINEIKSHVCNLVFNKDFFKESQKSSNIICCFNPLNTHEEKCFNVSHDVFSVDYQGRSIQIITNFCDIIQREDSIQCFLPLIDTIKDIDEISGSVLLKNILSFFGKIVKVREDLFIYNRFFELLSSFLFDCNPKYITIDVVSELFLIFDKLESQELKKSMITAIFMNYEFSFKLDKSVSEIFLPYSPLHYYQTNALPHQIVLDNISQIIYRTIQFHNEKSTSSDFAWDFVSRLVDFSLNENCIDSLIMMLLTKKSHYIVNKILNIIKTLISPKTVSYFKKFSYYIPFIIIISERNHENILLSLEIIHLISNNVDIDLNRVIYDIVIVIPCGALKSEIKNETNPEINHEINCQNGEYDQFLHSLLKLIMNNKLIAFIPLLVHILQNGSQQTKDEAFHQIISTFLWKEDDIYSLHSWFYWLTKFCLTVIGSPSQNPNKFAKPFLDISSKIEELFNFFDFYGGLINENFFEIKKILILNLLKNNECNVENYYSIIFGFLFFSSSTIKLNGTIKHPLLLENIALDILSNFKTSYKNEVDIQSNHEIAYLLVSKTMNCENLIKIGEFNPAPIILFNTIIVVSYFSHNKDIFDELTEKIREKLENNLEYYDETVKNTCLLYINQNCNNSTEFPTEIKKSTMVSNEFVDCEGYFDKLDEKLSSIQKELVYDFVLITGLKSDCYIGENCSVIQQLISIIDSKCYDMLYFYIKVYENDHKAYFENDKITLIKMKESFMRKISKIPGPWHVQNKDQKFKALNRVTKVGKKLFLKINDKFSDHKDASLNRNGHNMIKNEDTPFQYKPLKEISYYQNMTQFQTNGTYIDAIKNLDGTISVSKEHISFVSNQIESKSIFILLKDVEFILNRRYANIDTACEIFIRSGRSFFLILSNSERERFYKQINKFYLHHPNKSKNKFDFFSSLRKICHGFCQNKTNQVLVQNLKLQNLWENRKITTYSYLYYLNLLSGRSFQDLKQYPIFPFIIKDYSQNVIDLKDESIYRDFSLHVGAINPNFRNDYLQKYESSDDIPEFRYLFGQLPSSEMIVVWYQIRIEPFTTIHVTKMQNHGELPRFDLPDRQLFSMKNLIFNLSEACGVKEFIPEFFFSPNFLVNDNNFDLGILSDGMVVNDVELLDWSQNEYTFIAVLRQMLEGEIADNNINKWIDLFFGPYRNSLSHFSVYKPFVYPENADALHMEEVLHFGCIPAQLFSEEHPQRKNPSFSSASDFNQLLEDGKIKKGKVTHFLKNIMVINSSFGYEIGSHEILEFSLPIGCGSLLCASKLYNLLIFGTKESPFLTLYNYKLNEQKACFYLPSIIISAAIAGSRYLITGCNDCSLTVWDLLNYEKISSSSYHTDFITAVGCNYECGLIVSYDKSDNLVFETLYDHIFITSISLKSENTKGSEKYDMIFIPQILVFKSGIVCVSQREEIAFFDTHGKEITRYQLNGPFIEMHKYYDFDTREILIIGSKPNQICIFDLTLLAPIVIFESYFDKLYPIKNSRSFIKAYKSQFHSISFSENISSIVSKSRTIAPVIKCY
ncbi:hypothetical protein TRFO_04701 [Tritrichomonas foetus]|uniref:Beige/BEACH domain containing protein n=1 Tax=Tritrichomonas foetus TaxID=1144522 RepID=A0A1J4KIG9_9EUKA|nr:hypothetical protein TRFO_04701 [Tritrichomonas foetus]|eukprot:OHT09101.1 hypothetical protein TRFO_04701 [Tritrichomonas foetus]